MASSRQIAANRANAKKSTGPKRSDGKARSKRNAVTHGLTATEIVVAQEEPEQFEAFRSDLMADLTPEGIINNPRGPCCAAKLGSFRKKALAATVT